MEDLLYVEETKLKEIRKTKNKNEGDSPSDSASTNPNGEESTNDNINNYEEEKKNKSEKNEIDEAHKECANFEKNVSHYDCEKDKGNKAHKECASIERDGAHYDCANDEGNDVHKDCANVKQNVEKNGAHYDCEKDERNKAHKECASIEKDGAHYDCADDGAHKDCADLKQNEAPKEGENEKNTDDKPKTKTDDKPVIIPPKRQPNKVEERKMLAKTVQIMALVGMENHVYKFANTLRKQKAGGPIGLALTGDIADCYLIEWDKKFIKKLESLGINLIFYKRYKDDITIIAEAVEKGTAFENGTITIDLEQTEKDSDKSDDVITMDLIVKIAESVDGYDIPGNHISCKLPVLDVEISVNQMRTIVWNMNFMRNPQKKGCIQRGCLACQSKTYNLDPRVPAQAP